MDTRSVTRPPLPSTTAVVAGAHLCDQISALLLIEPKVVRQAFLGEPVEEVMAMVKWVLKHEGETEFDPERILPAREEKRAGDVTFKESVTEGVCCLECTSVPTGGRQA
jgi:hypothetical protein